MLQIQDVGDGAPLHPHVSACYVGCGHDRPVECKVDGLAAIHVLVDAGDYPAVGHHAEAVGRRLLPEQEDHAVVKEWRLPAAVRIAQKPPAAVDVVGEGGTDVGRGMPIWMAWERHTGQLLRSITGMSHSEHHLTVVATAVVIIALFLTLPVFYYVIEMPPFAVGIAALFYAILAIAMVYYAMERFKEIDEGLDDAVDDY